MSLNKHIQNADFVISAANQTQWPESELPEIVLAGRSNVGKSSLINTLVNRKKLAYVGNTPGKTKLLNFFNLDNKYMFVDVPGYGYANTSKSQLIKFGEMMEDYFHYRTQAKCLILIVDARHKPTQDDINMLEFARYYHLATIVVATKVDKVKNSQLKKAFDLIKTTLNLNDEMLVSFSSETKKGRETLWQSIDHYCGYLQLQQEDSSTE